MKSNDDATPYQEFAAALLDLIAEKQNTQDRRTRLTKARASIDIRDPRYWQALDRACLNLIERSSVSHWMNRPTL